MIAPFQRAYSWRDRLALWLAVAALLAVVAGCMGCRAPMIAKQYDIRVYQYGVGDNSVSSEFLKETSVDPSLNLKR